MTMLSTMGRSLKHSAPLAISCVLCIGLAANTFKTPSNTSPVPKAQVVVAPPSADDLAAERHIARLNALAQALSPRDAALYRAIFAVQHRGDIGKADQLIADLSDTRLMGYVLADRFEKNPQSANAAALTAWLSAYADLPQAESLAAQAAKLGAVNAPRPRTPAPWGSGQVADSAADLRADVAGAADPAYPEQTKFARQIEAALRQKNGLKAKELIDSVRKSHKLPAALIAQAQAATAAQLFYAGERAGAGALAKTAAEAGHPLGLWLQGLAAWEQNDHEAARAVFTRLAANPALAGANKAAALFWAGRAEDKAGHPDAARSYFAKAVQQEDRFYSQLAAQKLGQTDSLKELAARKDEGATAFSPEHRAILSAHPGGGRALALIQIGRIGAAEEELRRVSPAGSPARLRAMLALSRAVPMPALSVRLSSLQSAEAAQANAYPLLPWAPEGGFDVDRALLFALALQESRFDPSAVSHRGAHGLLQIMPATARHLSDGQTRDRDLLDPTISMTLGQKYLRHLSELPLIGDNLILLLAAYNGGPTKVVRWAETKGAADPLLFLETYPVRETRAYIARVLPHYWAYRARLGLSTASLRQLADGQWPQIALREDKKNLRLADAR